jgi:hypothetical protein
MSYISSHPQQPKNAFTLTLAPERLSVEVKRLWNNPSSSKGQIKALDCLAYEVMRCWQKILMADLKARDTLPVLGKLRGCAVVFS